MTIKANIRQSIMVSSKTLNFRGKEGEVLTQTVDIIAQEERPLNIEAGVFNLQEKMIYKIEEVEKGKEFKVIFTNIPQSAGRFNGSLTLMTNYDDSPEIKISLRGSFSKDRKDNGEDR